MNPRTKRLKAEKSVIKNCKCSADYKTRTIYVCDHCRIYSNLPKIIHVPEEERIGK